MNEDMIKDLIELLESWVMDDEQDILVIFLTNKEIRLTKDVKTRIDARQGRLDFSRQEKETVN